MGIKCYEVRARSSLQVSEAGYYSFPQDCVCTACPFFQLQRKREADSSIKEDTTQTEHWLSSPFCQTFTIPTALWLPGHHYCWFCHSSKLRCTQQTAWHLSPKSPFLFTGWPGKQNRAGCSAPKFWFPGIRAPLPPWFMRNGEEEESSLLLCAWSPVRNELAQHSNCSEVYGRSGRQSSSWVSTADWNVITRQATGLFF